MIRILLVTFFLMYNLYANSYGALLLHGNCTTCHNLDKSISIPSLQLIKQRYIEVSPKKKEFIAYMSIWVLKPKKRLLLCMI